MTQAEVVHAMTQQSQSRKSGSPPRSRSEQLFTSRPLVCERYDLTETSGGWRLVDKQQNQGNGTFIALFSERVLQRRNG